MSVLYAKLGNFDEVVLQSDRPVLLDFYADWCGPCRMVAPILEEIAAEHPEYKVVKVNVDDEPALAERYGIMSIPTLIVFKDGEAVNKIAGALPKAQILAMLS